MIKDSLEHLIKIATDAPFSNDLLVARKEYQKYIGDIKDGKRQHRLKAICENLDKLAGSPSPHCTLFNLHRG